MRPYRGMTKEGEWVKGWYVYDPRDDIHYIVKFKFNPFNQWLLNRIEVIPETVGQSTGEFDKERSHSYPKGREIFDGDTVKASIYDDEEPQILKVYYEKGAYWIDYEDSESDRVPIGCFIGSLEIIGTIHDKDEEKE